MNGSPSNRPCSRQKDLPQASFREGLPKPQDARANTVAADFTAIRFTLLTSKGAVVRSGAVPKCDYVGVTRRVCTGFASSAGLSLATGTRPVRRRWMRTINRRETFPGMSRCRR